ncbi:MAG: hypothetical protein HY584_01610 [Candidatus Omnitrophica bacterium]|nr:hypothetical protein [Candidatus Omnitrophota bacterium]
MWMLIFFVAVIGFAQPAHAEIFDAIVTAVYDGGSTIEATVKDPFGTMEEKVRLSIDPDVELEGLASLRDLKTGQRLQVEAKRDFPDLLVVHKIIRKPESGT